MKHKLLLLGLLIVLLPQSGYSKRQPQQTIVDSVQITHQIDSIRQIRFEEVDFIIDQIENTYVCGRRGIGDEQWQRQVEYIYYYLDNNRQFYYNNEYLFACRYMGLLTADAHFAFPDTGALNRHGLFSHDDLVFPLWVQTWTDGTVYNVKDYSGVIPKYAKIVSVNGYSANDIALTNRKITPGEEIYNIANINSYHEPSPLNWANFTNFLFTTRINSPYKVVYTEFGSDRTDTVILNGMRRQDKFNQFRYSGDRRRSKSERGFPRKPIVYTNAGDNIGVLAINSFWGKRWSHMMLFGKDWRYKRLLRTAMRKIDRDNIQDLVIDISLNSGGMDENIYYTLNYLTDKPIDITHKYLITDNNRKQAKMNIERSPHIAEADRNYLIGHIDTLASGTLFRTDTVRTLQYIPSNPKHTYNGNVYVLTGNQTYSAAQIFARYCQTLGIAPVAGQHCGGYNEVTGNASRVELPYLKWMEFNVPFSSVIVCKDDDPYDYPTVDIPIDHPFDEWLKRENHSLDKLIEIIRGKSREEKTLSM